MISKFCIVLILSPMWPAIFFPLNSLPGSKNTEILVKKSVKDIKKMTVNEKIAAAEEAKKTPDKKKK